jgi:hypothetical protein
MEIFVFLFTNLMFQNRTKNKNKPELKKKQQKNKQTNKKNQTNKTKTKQQKKYFVINMRYNISTSKRSILS